ncbi:MULTISPECIES: hypothetical protein [Burkholderia]|uniref:hypothetical protein n=1 Tax=Burkholderia TaxID=32008 RepID=UPI000A9C1AD3|nr:MULTISPECIES: hypothetical protein [Burkholderia]
MNAMNANIDRAADRTTSAPIYQVDAFVNRRFAGNPAALDRCGVIVTAMDGGD